MNRRRHIVAHRVGNRGDPDKRERTAFEGLPAVLRPVATAVRKAQRTHRHILVGRQLRLNGRLIRKRSATIQHDLRSTLDIEVTAAERGVDQRGHKFSFGRKSELVDYLGPIAQCGIIDPLVTQPQQQRSFGRITDHLAVRIEECRGVRGNPLANQVVDPLLIKFRLVHTHLIARQRTGLIRADHRNGPHRFAGVHLAHEIVRLEHPAHIDRQRQRHAHRQSFGNCHDDQRDSHHKVLQHPFGNRDPVGFQQSSEKKSFDQQRDERQHGQRDSRTADQFRQPSQLQVQRRLLLTLDRRLFGHLAELGSIPHLLYDHHPVTFDHRRPPQHLVRRIGRIVVEMGRIGRLVDHRLAGQRRFVDFERHGLMQPSVGGNLLSALENHHIPHHDVLFGNLHHLSVPDNLDRRIVVRAVEQVEFAHRIVFEPKGDARCQENRTEDSDRLGKFIVNETDPERQECRNE